MPLDANPAAAEIRIETAHDRPRVEALFDAAFGPGRLAKSAARVRERTAGAPELSVTMVEGDRCVGAARQHRLRLGGQAGTFLGPFAVASDRRGLNYGPRLIGAAVEAARVAGLDFVLLIGPESYFAPLGFAPVAEGSIDLGAPIDPARLLIRTLGGREPPSGRAA